MKNVYKLLIGAGLLLSAPSCKKDLLDTKSQTILKDEQVWPDPKVINNVLANLYDRLPKHSFLTATEFFTTYDEAMWSGLSNNDLEARNTLLNYGYDRWRLWDYGFIRDVNVAIDNLGAASSLELTPLVKKQFLAELRFLRALDYFEMVKRMGGVPIITTQLIYDFSGDPSYLRHPRNTEAEVYDFIASEMDAIKNDLGNAGSNRRANKFTALALKSRAMLYAASIAKYNNLPGFTSSNTPGAEVGIPASRANEYYQKSLDASNEIFTTGSYSLYKKNTSDVGENFYNTIIDKSSNPEIIMANDFSKAAGRRHLFTFNTIPRSMFEDGGQGSSNISPSLNLVESFDYLDGSTGTLKGVGTGSNTAAGQANWIFYSNPQDIFANKDARLYGTILYPGTSFAGKTINMQAGLYVWNASTNKYDRAEGDLNSTQNGKLLTALDGPHRATTFVSNTGFYLRKYVDASPGASASSIQSDTWWVLFRLGEIYLNAAEAAFELGLTPNALNYINTLRQRAGFPANSLTTLTMDKIQNERKVELAFEDHRVWDLKRWRIADKVWDGTATNPNANVYALYPYRIVRPGHANDGKYVFDKFIAPRFKAPRFFRPGNYYSSIAQSVIDNNPKIVRNPFH